MNPHTCHHCHHHPVPEGYYWRDYTGEIPNDAFPGGHDSNGQPTYIGQAYLPNGGVVPSNIYRGQAGMHLPSNWKANYSDLAMKVLCTSSPSSLSWVNATASDIHLVTAGKQLVIGGYHPGAKGTKKLLNVGRALHQGELSVGKLLAYDGGPDKLHFIGGGTEISVASYQALVLNSPSGCC